MDSEDSTRIKRKCISPIEAPKPDPTRLTDSNLQLSFETLHESNHDTSPTIERHASYSHSDFAVDYHDCADDLYGHYEEYEEEPSLDQTDSRMKAIEEHLEVDTEDYYHRESHTETTQDEDTDKTEDHPQQDGQQETYKPDINRKIDLKVNPPIIAQTYFFSRELADKMNATEIKETFNQHRGNKNIACSVLQLKYPHGGHFIYFHTYEGRFKTPHEITLFTGFRVTLEPPRKRIDRLCDCKILHSCKNC